MMYRRHACAAVLGLALACCSGSALGQTITKPFLWDPASGLQMLDFGVPNVVPVDVNDAGQVLGYA